MNRSYEVLYEIQKNGFQNQREIAAHTGFSLGYVNTALKNLLEQSYLCKENRKYRLTKAGVTQLEKFLQEGQGKKIVLRDTASRIPVKEAVILAAGANQYFQQPVGMLEINGESLLHRMIKILRECGIERICVVGGYEMDQLSEHLAQAGVDLIENAQYKWNGTMASLASAKNWITGNFMLVESNQIFEEIAIQYIYHSPSDNAMLMVSPSGSMDEAYVELDTEGNIFRISKDIRQMNRIDGELVGVSKISQELFSRMMEYYKGNENPMINYEYVMESLGRTYQIPAVHIDDLQWGVIENEKHLHKAKQWLYSRIRKKEMLRRENIGKQIFAKCMEISQDEIKNFKVSGGLTNTNFYVETKKDAYILRIPGAGTDQMVNRHLEKANSLLGEKLGINAPILYFDENSGIKIAKYITNARTLNGPTARMEPSMKKTVDLLHCLHNSGIQMGNQFSVRAEYEKYKEQAIQAYVQYYPEYEEMDAFFYVLEKRLEVLGEASVSCHNDLVPENFIDGQGGRRYLIDWEYAGMNDPMWDIASHLLECEFSKEEEKLFLEYYFQGTVDAVSQEKIAIYKIMQDILWSLWTMIKEAKGEDFGTYGPDRMKRAIGQREEYVRLYEDK